MFDDSVFLITGGTGSFGHAIVTRLLQTDARQVRVFSRDEKKQTDMRIAYADPRLRFHLGDVRDYDSVQQAMAGVDYVFHAAALKQVPSCEFHPMEAVRTNILGTDNVLGAAVARSCRKVVVLSTDKAVYPINAMGLSKSMLEKLMIARSRTLGPDGPVLSGTRYGNVMGSRGSVIPLFIEQIRSHQPLTVTDPEMTRFLLTMDGAIDLVIHAFETADQGDLFVKRAPACTIRDLAQALCEVFEVRPEVKVIGTRHGEKRHETMLTRAELARAACLGDFYRVPADAQGSSYDAYYTCGNKAVALQEDYTSQNTTRLSVAEVRDLLMDLEVVREHLEVCQP